MPAFHHPVLLQECLGGLNIDPNGVYVDVTYGGGGHSRAILEKLENGRLIAFDQDPDAGENAIQDDRFVFINHNFEHLERFLKLHKAIPVNGILADLGVSSYQIDTPGRGFSTRFEGELDMRMNKEQVLTAATVVNNYSEKQLQEVLSSYGELRNARTAAKAIVSGRQGHPLQTTADLTAILEPVIRGKRNKYLARAFQAIRIEVNHEMDVLRKFLEQSAGVLMEKGRLVVMSYHSLEDRLVKNYINKGTFSGDLKKDFYGQPIRLLKAVNRKPILPTDKEKKDNPRARSAKLRIAEKLTI